VLNYVQYLKIKYSDVNIENSFLLHIAEKEESDLVKLAIPSIPMIRNTETDSPRKGF
jgi:hypothetical protein